MPRAFALSPPLNRRSGLRRSRGSVPVPARTREQPSTILYRPDARWLSRRARGVDRLYIALRRSFGCSLLTARVRSAARARSRRSCWVALPGYGSAGPGRQQRPDTLRCRSRALRAWRRFGIFSAGWASGPARSGKLPGTSALRSILPLGRTGVRRRPRGVAIAARSLWTPGWVGDDAFLAGYGAAQAVPGPLFTFAAYLGAVVTPSPHGLTGAVLGLIGILLPGVLVLVATLPFWESFRKRAGTQAVMRVVNAAVVGLLGGALYDPVWTSSVKTPEDFAIALVGFVLLIPSGVRRRWSSLSSARSGGSPLRSPCHDAMRSR